MSQLMTDVAVSRAVATKTYSVTQFYRGQPSITRLHNDQQLTDADLQEPFSEDNRKPVKIAKLIGYDVALVGSLDDYQFTDNQVTVTVSGRLIEVETGRKRKGRHREGGREGVGGRARGGRERDGRPLPADRSCAAGCSHADAKGGGWKEEAERRLADWTAGGWPGRGHWSCRRWRRRPRRSA
jgi:hypothetical protein